jgi:hypothetical protein
MKGAVSNEKGKKGKITRCEGHELNTFQTARIRTRFRDTK